MRKIFVFGLLVSAEGFAFCGKLPQPWACPTMPMCSSSVRECVVTTCTDGTIKNSCDEEIDDDDQVISKKPWRKGNEKINDVLFNE